MDIDGAVEYLYISKPMAPSKKDVLGDKWNPNACFHAFFWVGKADCPKTSNMVLNYVRHKDFRIPVYSNSVAIAKGQKITCFVKPKADNNKKRDSDASKGDAPSKKSKSSGSKDSKQVAVAIDAD